MTQTIREPLEHLTADWAEIERHHGQDGTLFVQIYLAPHAYEGPILENVLHQSARHIVHSLLRKQSIPFAWWVREEMGGREVRFLARPEDTIPAVPERSDPEADFEPHLRADHLAFGEAMNEWGRRLNELRESHDASVVAALREALSP